MFGFRKTVHEARKLNAEETRQAKLRMEAQKQGLLEDVDEEVIVIEKNNMAKFLIKTFGIICVKAANILLVTLAIIGLVAIVYPEPRACLIEIFSATVDFILK